MRTSERDFEVEIVSWLTAHGGYSEGVDRSFDPVSGLDKSELFEFLATSQRRSWDRLQELHGGDSARARAAFLQRLVSELDRRGTIDVLRNGVIDHSIHIRLAYFRPAHSLTPDVAQLYAANRLTLTRQLQFEATSNGRLDLALFVNGLPVATAELKNPLTGQTVEDAKNQYRTDRNPINTILGRRAVVHFAMDTEQVAMTTKLAGQQTRFLPFNKGNGGGAGNPINPFGHRTAYMWEQVWRRDPWLDLLQRYIHVDRDGKTHTRDGVVIFPRHHQWDAVQRIEEAVRRDGFGRDYLIQHSAGSGKSNTIAWLSHRLANMHDAADEPFFDKIVVITDRRVLDAQLQDTIYQFDHAHGVVEKIDEDSTQLAEALAGKQAQIIITTLQKFPVVLRQGLRLPDRRYGVIVDEAHSSQTGESAKDLKAVLGRLGESELPADSGSEQGGFAGPSEEILLAMAKSRKRQPNISFFAFTATPKGRTLEQFGQKNGETNRYEAFHTYSMRQAIEEGFILDVLLNYITYESYWKIEKKVPDDPAYDTAKARAAIARFVSLHDYNLDQKSEVIIEHFRRHVQHKIGGRVKAMVVTSSRLHAVRYKQALTKYCWDKGYNLGILVAFSGTVLPGTEDWTESKMNDFPESQTTASFGTDEWQVLVVAEKYQTGFDQPLLYAMYVDKVLTDLAAVQTLSRLNRTYEGKDGTFVLDFRNDAESIQHAFEPWYATTVATPTDPNLLYDTRHALDPFNVLREDEISSTVRLIVGGQEGAHGRIHAALSPAIERYNSLDEPEKNLFYDAMHRFVRTYAFLSQVVSFVDVKLERDYIYAKALALFTRKNTGTSLDLGSAVELTHLRIEQTFAGSISLDSGHGDVQTLFGGAGSVAPADEESLSKIIDKLNKRFGTDWSPEDRVFYDTIADKLTRRGDIQRAAAVNTPENFSLILHKAFISALIEQMGISEDMALKLIDDVEMQQEVVAAYLPLIQSRARVAWQEHCPIVELLGPDRESDTLEYKSTLRTRAESGELYKPLEGASLKTIAAFLNARDGGTLVIGVADDGSAHGLEADYASLRKEGRDDRDLFQLHLGNIVDASMGTAAATNITVQFHSIDDRDVCRVHVRPSAFPVDAKITVDRKSQFETISAFFVRVANGTKKLDHDQRAKYVSGRWPSAKGL
jgi:type I restriction enzyme R subunit